MFDLGLIKESENSLEFEKPDENLTLLGNPQQIDPLLKVKESKIEKLLKFLKHSNLGTLLQNLLSIFRGPSTCSINLEKFLDLDGELLQIWNGLINNPNIFQKLTLYHYQIQKKLQSLKQDLDGIQFFDNKN